MRRITAITILAAAAIACGGDDPEFDEDAFRAYFAENFPSGDVDEATSMIRDVCADEDLAFRMFLVATNDIDSLWAACPERVAASFAVIQPAGDQPTLEEVLEVELGDLLPSG